MFYMCIICSHWIHLCHYTTDYLPSDVDLFGLFFSLASLRQNVLLGTGVNIHCKSNSSICFNIVFPMSAVLRMTIDEPYVLFYPLA